MPATTTQTSVSTRTVTATSTTTESPHVTTPSPGTYDVQVSDIFGMPVAGASVTLHFDNGTQVSSYTNAQGIASFPRSPDVPDSGTIQYLGMSYQVPIDGPMTGSTSITLVLSYPLLYAVLAFAVLLSGVAIAIRHTHKKLQPW
jgi:hypothetical protein